MQSYPTHLLKSRSNKPKIIYYHDIKFISSYKISPNESRKKIKFQSVENKNIKFSFTLFDIRVFAILQNKLGSLEKNKEVIYRSFNYASKCEYKSFSLDKSF